MIDVLQTVILTITLLCLLFTTVVSSIIAYMDYTGDRNIRWYFICLVLLGCVGLGLGLVWMGG